MHPIDFVYVRKLTPSEDSIFTAIAPVATRPIVSRPDERPPPR